MTARLPAKPVYTMKLSLNVLNHLGINLYSNVAAVVAETVANAWDADAKKVTIKVDVAKDRIEIEDDGHGMDYSDINNRFLLVGYQKREDPAVPKTTALGRQPMGRKGIGKLSLFSIAENIEVHSRKKGGAVNAFELDVGKIKAAIDANNGEYHPEAIKSTFRVTHGTKLILSRLKSRVSRTAPALRRRLARRFGIIGAGHNFRVVVNAKGISAADRDYYHKIEYLWYYGQESQWVVDEAKNARQTFERSNAIKGGLQISGWIASAEEAGQLKDEFKENLNRIVIMVRDKLAQDDVLEDFGEGGVYSKYLFGEINADFLDVDGSDDIATSNRQQIIEDDPRYVELRDFVFVELKNIKNEWNRLRAERGLERAKEVPAIKKWLATLDTEVRPQAAALFGKINQVPVQEESDRNALFVHGVLAFETFRFRNALDKIESINVENLPLLKQVFGKLDDIEAALYYQITKERLEMIRRLQSTVAANALEKVIQEHLFDHLWLLDPSWDRATEQPFMEQRVKNVIDKLDAGLTKSERLARLDLRYKSVSGRHVIIELKRPGISIRTPRLYEQIGKYRSGLQKLFNKVDDKSPMEFICLLGKEPTDWKENEGQKRSIEMLKIVDARIVFYDGLLASAFSAYQQYLEKEVDAGRVFRLVQELDPEYFK